MEQAREELARYLTKQFIWHDPAMMPDDECYEEADYILSTPGILIKDDNQDFPECPYSYKGWTQYEESICREAYQQMKDNGWVKVKNGN